ncbi:MAG: phycobiliprotein lyase, partial [Synechococcaceae bacterium WB9_3_282]|nr:phycobiliprotein lyase [Synechococcaceae bacterium WB9_3_282]
STVEGLSNTASLCIETRLNSNQQSSTSSSSNSISASLLGW